MKLISQQTRRIIQESFQTLIIAGSLLIFAIFLSFVKDFAVETKRPQWLIFGIETISVILFTGDALVMLNVVARIVFRAFRDLLDEVKKGRR